MAGRNVAHSILVGSPTLSTPSHISLLLHNLFNASIPSAHIPADTWHFDPDFPVPAAIQESQNLKWPVAPVVVEPETQPEVEPEATQVTAEGEEATQETVEGEEIVEEIQDQVEEEIKEEEMVVGDEEVMYRERGWWRHNVTNEPLGGEDGRIEFVVIGFVLCSRYPFRN